MSFELMKGCRRIACCDWSHACGSGRRDSMSRLPTTLKTDGAPSDGADQALPAISFFCADATIMANCCSVSAPFGPVGGGTEPGVVVTSGAMRAESSSRCSHNTVDSLKPSRCTRRREPCISHSTVAITRPLTHTPLLFHTARQSPTRVQPLGDGASTAGCTRLELPQPMAMSGSARRAMMRVTCNVERRKLPQGVPR
eukprot:scaffold3161_cov118-Isochrysis_galbana.AAC.23